MRNITFAVCMFLANVAGVESASAQPAAGGRLSASVEVLHATNAKPAKVAPGFESFAKRQPWSSYSSFSLAQRSSYALEPGKKQKIALPGGAWFELTLRAGGANPKFDYSLNGTGNASINTQVGQKVALSGGPTKDGILIVIVGF